MRAAASAASVGSGGASSDGFLRMKSTALLSMSSMAPILMSLVRMLSKRSQSCSMEPVKNTISASATGLSASSSTISVKTQSVPSDPIRRSIASIPGCIM